MATTLAVTDLGDVQRIHIPEPLAEMHARIPDMGDELLVFMHEQTGQLGRAAWEIEAHILWEARRRQADHKDRAVAAVAARFRISKSLASKRIKIWELFGAEFRHRNTDPDGWQLAEVSWYEKAAYTDDPHRWLAHAAERKCASPEYTIADFVADIAAAQPGAILPDPPTAGKLAPLLSSRSDAWRTPPQIVEAVIGVLGHIDLDPCAEEGDPKTIPARTHLTQADDGLAADWSGTVYLNPPYGATIPRWIAKLIAAYESGAVPAAVALVPARTDTDWFWPLYAYPLCFVHGRLNFSDHEHGAPFPSALVYLGRDHEGFTRHVGHLGAVVGTRAVWQAAGAAAHADPAEQPAPDQRATERQRTFIAAIAREAGLAEEELAAWAQELFGADLDRLTRRDAAALIEALQRRRAEVA